MLRCNQVKHVAPTLVLETMAASIPLRGLFFGRAKTARCLLRIKCPGFAICRGSFILKDEWRCRELSHYPRCVRALCLRNIIREEIHEHPASCSRHNRGRRLLLHSIRGAGCKTGPRHPGRPADARPQPSPSCGCGRASSSPPSSSWHQPRLRGALPLVLVIR